MKSTETATAEITLYEGEYVVLRYKKDAVVNLKEAIEIFEKATQLTKAAKLPALVDARQLKELTQEARAFQGSKQSTENAVAVAILISSLTTRIIANLFITFQKPHYSTKVFSDETEAIDWLQPFIKGVF